MTIRTPHPLNVPADFYVEDNCCLVCDIPRTIAPDLFALEGEDGHCFVRRQPSSAPELDRMFNAIRTAELQCIRYGGLNRMIQVRLVEANDGATCDNLPEDLKERAAAVAELEAKREHKR